MRKIKKTAKNVHIEGRICSKTAVIFISVSLASNAPSICPRQNASARAYSAPNRTASLTPYAQELPADNLLQNAVRPISTFHVGPDQPNPRPQTLTLTLILIPTLVEGSRSAAAVARLRCFWWRLKKKARAAENPISTNQTSALQEVICK